MAHPTEQNSLVDSQLKALAEICCRDLQHDDNPDSERDEPERIEPLIKALVANGFARSSEKPLSLSVEELVHEQCSEDAVPRHERLTAMTKRMQTMFEDQVRMQTSTPLQEDHTRDDEVTPGSGSDD